MTNGHAAFSHNSRIFVVLALVIVAIEWLVVQNSAFRNEPDLLGLGITLDLVVGMPLLGYLFLVRPRKAPWWILLFLLIEGMIVAKLLLPAEQEHFLEVVEFGAIAAELALVGLLLMRARRLVRSYRAIRPCHVYSIDAVEESLSTAIGEKWSKLVASEVAVLDYAFRGWWRRPMTSAPGRRVFAYHRRGGYVMVFATFVFLVALETVIMHLVVSQWSTTVAWVLSALGIVGLLWMWGDFQAMRHEPIAVMPDTLEIRAGVRWHARIAWGDVTAVHTHKPKDSGPELSLVLWGDPDFWIELRHDVAMRGVYGIQRPTRLIGVGADDAPGLRAAIEEHMSRHQ